MGKEEQLLRLLPAGLRNAVIRDAGSFDHWREIRLRVGKPVIFVEKTERILPITVKEQEIRECLQAAAHYSLFAYEEEMKQGFLTVQGGHRIGIAGHVRLEQGRVRLMKQVSSLNIRVAHEVQGCGKPLLSPLFGDRKRRNVLLISPPGAGKTTCLRDLVRLLANGEAALGPVTVGIVDERSELAACHQGMPLLDLGLRSDVLDGCSKAEGIYMLLRSMSPDFLAVDEISLPEDAAALLHAVGCGCHFLATLHGDDLEALKRPALCGLWENRMFERYVILEKPVGGIREILDREGRAMAVGGRR